MPRTTRRASIAHVGALRVLGDELGVGVTVFVEGEEEIGSPTFADVPAHATATCCAADVIVVADSSNWAVGVPGLTTSLRGLVDCVVEVAVLEHAVHSGMFGGAVLDAPDAARAPDHHAARRRRQRRRRRASCTRRTRPSTTTRPRSAPTPSVLDGVRLAGTGPITARLWTRPAIGVIGFDAPRVAQRVEHDHARARRPSSRSGSRPARTRDAAMDALRTHLRRRTRPSVPASP